MVQYLQGESRCWQGESRLRQEDSGHHDKVSLGLDKVVGVLTRRVGAPSCTDECALDTDMETLGATKFSMGATDSTSMGAPRESWNSDVGPGSPRSNPVSCPENLMSVTRMERFGRWRKP